MTTELSITASPRKVFGKLTNKLRNAGKLPAVLYGRGKDTIPLEVPAREFQKMYKAAGENTLVNLVIEGSGEKKVLIHDVAHHYSSQTPIHVDFYEVDLTRKIHAKIPLHYVGVSGAVKELGGILVKTLNEVEVEALPTDLPPFLEIDISKLKTFEDSIHIRDIVVGDKVKLLAHDEEMVSSVQPPRTEEELAELEKPTAAETEKAAIEGMAAEDAAAKAAEGDEETKEGEEKKDSAPEADEKK